MGASMIDGTATRLLNTCETFAKTELNKLANERIQTWLHMMRNAFKDDRRPLSNWLNKDLDFDDSTFDDQNLPFEAPSYFLEHFETF